MIEDLNVKRLEAENNYLDYKIDRYTGLIIGKVFTKVERGLLEHYIGRMINRKLENQKLLSVITNE